MCEYSDAADNGGMLFSRQKVPPFARYEGTSAWHKDHKRVRAYARFRAAAKQASETPGTPKP